jgi:hypothetical protein
MPATPNVTAKTASVSLSVLRRFGQITFFNSDHASLRNENIFPIKIKKTLSQKSQAIATICIVYRLHHQVNNDRFIYRG